MTTALQHAARALLIRLAVPGLAEALTEPTKATPSSPLVKALLAAARSPEFWAEGGDLKQLRQTFEQQWLDRYKQGKRNPKTGKTVPWEFPKVFIGVFEALDRYVANGVGKIDRKRFGRAVEGLRAVAAGVVAAHPDEAPVVGGS